jgi:hypothetical protein
MPDNIRENFAQEASRAQSDAIISLVIGLACCSPVGLVLSIRALHRASALLAELQHSEFGGEFQSKVSGARIVALVGIVLSAMLAMGSAGCLTRSMRMRA